MHCNCPDMDVGYETWWYVTPGRPILLVLNVSDTCYGTALCTVCTTLNNQIMVPELYHLWDLGMDTKHLKMFPIQVPLFTGNRFWQLQVHKEHKVATHLWWGNGLYQGQDLTNRCPTWLGKGTKSQDRAMPDLTWPDVRRHRPVFTYKAIHTLARWHPSAAHWRGLHQAGGKWERGQQKTGWDPGIRRKRTLPFYTLCFFIVSRFHCF